MPSSSASSPEEPSTLAAAAEPQQGSPKPLPVSESRQRQVLHANRDAAPSSSRPAVPRSPVDLPTGSPGSAPDSRGRRLSLPEYHSTTESVLSDRNGGGDARDRRTSARRGRGPVSVLSRPSIPSTARSMLEEVTGPRHVLRGIMHLLLPLRQANRIHCRQRERQNSKRNQPPSQPEVDRLAERYRERDMLALVRLDPYTLEYRGPDCNTLEEEYIRIHNVRNADTVPRMLVFLVIAFTGVFTLGDMQDTSDPTKTVVRALQYGGIIPITITAYLFATRFKRTVVRHYQSCAMGVSAVLTTIEFAQAVVMGIDQENNSQDDIVYIHPINLFVSIVFTISVFGLLFYNAVRITAVYYLMFIFTYVALNADAMSRREFWREFFYQLLFFSFASVGQLYYLYNMEILAREDHVRWRLVQIDEINNEKLLSNILPSFVVEEMKAGVTNIVHEYPVLTVLFADVVGFTSLCATMTPQETVHMLNLLFNEFDRLCAYYGIEKIKTIGDAYMAMGIPNAPPEDVAVRVVGFAMAMREGLDRVARRLPHKLQVRIGLNSGPVVAGVIGSLKFAYDVWGDAVNSASRMESHGAPGEIHVTAATANLIAGRYDLQRRGTIDVKGKGRMETFFVGPPKSSGAVCQRRTTRQPSAASLTSSASASHSSSATERESVSASTTASEQAGNFDGVLDSAHVEACSQPAGSTSGRSARAGVAGRADTETEAHASSSAAEPWKCDPKTSSEAQRGLGAAIELQTKPNRHSREEI